MEYISHRVNKKSELEQLDAQYGVEIDLRDSTDNSIYLEHDPFKLGENFEEYLKSYNHGTMILNIKSERIEYKILELLKKYNVENYFFLDSSFPMIKALSDIGENRIAMRYSEFEGMDNIRSMSGKVRWVWVDCFTMLPLNHEIFAEIKELGYNICLVSPELQGQDEKIEEYVKQLKDEEIQLDAICTKSYNIDRWKKLLV